MANKNWFIATLAVVVLVIIFLSSPNCGFFVPEPAEEEVNVCLHLSDYGYSTISQLKELGVRWVRTDWLVTGDNSMSDYSQRLQDNNINLLSIIDINTFNQTPSLEQWEGNLSEIVLSEGFNNTDAVEIWNEPNSDAYIPPETYYEMLKTGYATIKNYMDIPVVFAGVSPNNSSWQTYLDSVFAYGDTQDYFDYMGIHFYDDMQTNLETLHFVESLTIKPVWVTETGKPSMNNDEAGQAEYLSSVYFTFKSLVGKIFIYEFKDNLGLSPDKENYFGLLTVNGTQKEAYWVFRDINGK